MSIETTQAWCNNCGRETQHKIIHTEEYEVENKEDVTLARKKDVLSCRGCKEFIIREESSIVFLGNKNTQISYSPPRLWRQPPTWLVELGKIDPDLKGLLEEVYSAANDRQPRLLSMGIRAVLDRLMILVLNSDVGNFKNKLDKMVSEGNLTQNQSENIKIVIDAGSASSHRGFNPPRELREEMVIVMENLVREYYVTGPMLQTARLKIPPRP